MRDGNNHRPLPAGKIVVSARAIARLAAGAAIQTPGVVGMAAYPSGNGSLLLSTHDAYEGVEVHIAGDELAIDTYIIVVYGAPIVEVAGHVRANVQCAVERSLGRPAARISVRVQGARRVSL